MIKESHIKKLIDCSYCCVEAVAWGNIQAMHEESGLSIPMLQKMKIRANNLIGTRFLSGSEWMEAEELYPKLSIGCIALDEIMDGGVEAGQITEIFGKDGTGKTQMSMYLAFRCALPVEQGGLGKKAILLDREGNVTKKRIKNFVTSYKGTIDAAAVLGNVHIVRTINTEDLKAKFLTCGQLLSTEQYGLLVVDGLMTHFHAAFDYCTELSERQQFVLAFMNLLRRFAREHVIAVVLTNQVVASLDDQGVKAAGGNVLSHNVSTIIELTINKGTRLAKMFQSPYLPPKNAKFEIMQEGIVNVGES